MLEEKDLIKNEIYYAKGKYINIFKDDRNIHSFIHGFKVLRPCETTYTIIDLNISHLAKQKEGIRLATPEEKHWFLECEKANKFIPREEVLKSFNTSIELTSLPEKWCIKINIENETIVGKYFNTIMNASTYKNGWINKYLCSHDSSNNKLSNTSKASHSRNIVDGIEITFEQFKKWVLKEEVKEYISEYIESIENYSNYIIKGFIYKVLKNENQPISLKLNCNIKSGYVACTDLYCTYKYFKPSTKEAYDKQNSKTETKFEVGKWYKWYQRNHDNHHYGKCKTVNEIYLEMEPWITNCFTYMVDGTFLISESENIKEIPLEEIQQYLPDGHADKIKSKNTKFKVGDKVKIISRHPNNTTGSEVKGSEGKAIGKFAYVCNNSANTFALYSNKNNSGEYIGILCKDNLYLFYFNDCDLELIEKEWIPKVGDWAICIKTGFGFGDYDINKPFQITKVSEINKGHWGNGYFDVNIKGTNQPLFNFTHETVIRKALPHEIPITVDNEVVEMPINHVSMYLKDLSSDINYITGIDPYYIPLKDLPSNQWQVGDLVECVNSYKIGSYPDIITVGNIYTIKSFNEIGNGVVLKELKFPTIEGIFKLERFKFHSRPNIVITKEKIADTWIIPTYELNTSIFYTSSNIDTLSNNHYYYTDVGSLPIRDCNLSITSDNSFVNIDLMSTKINNTTSINVPLYEPEEISLL